MNIQTRKVTITAILAALCILLGLTPIGYIPIGPVVMTLMCIPVIIGTVSEGLGTGLILGFVFGVTSLMKALGLTLVPDPFGAWLISTYPLQAVATIFVPRLLIPVTTWLVYRALDRKKQKGFREKLNIGVGAFTGSVTNTVFFLGFLYVLLSPYADALAPRLGTTSQGLLSTIALIGTINGLPEAVVAVILSIPIVMAVKRLQAKNKR
jgi:uncharacterized membrane protein